MSVLTRSIALATAGNADVIDITQMVAGEISGSGLQNGLACIFCPSSTSGLTTIEYESGCLNDLRRLFDEIINPDRHYSHNARWGDGNGHSHVRAALLGASLTIPFNAGRLALGTWQQIVFIDFDNRPRQRELVLQLLGE